VTGAPNTEHEQILRVLGDFVVNLDRFSMTEERKTPEMRAQMTDLERLRHSASHVLATAILKIWPEAQFAAGPPVENGFITTSIFHTASHPTISKRSRRR